MNGFDTNNNDLNLSYTGPGEYSVITGIPGRFPVEPLFPTTANAIQTSYILSGYFYKAYSFTGTSGESFTLTSAQKFDIFMIGGGGSGAPGSSTAGPRERNHGRWSPHGPPRVLFLFCFDETGLFIVHVVPPPP